MPATAEPSPEQAAEQMRDATERLRDQAWMVAPLTTAPLQSADEDEAEPAPGAEI